MRVRYTDTALSEVDGILSHIARENRAAAGDVSEAIAATVKRIVDQPDDSPIVYDGAVRAKTVERFQYRVYYVTTEHEIIIRNVRSTRRMRPWERGRWRAREPSRASTL